MECTKDKSIGISQIQLTVIISAFNYGSAIRTLAPYILSEVSKQKHVKPFTDVLSGSPESTAAAVATAIDTLPQDMKNALASRAINIFESNLITLLLSFASKEGVKLSIGGLSAYPDGKGIRINIRINDIDFASATKLWIPVNPDGQEDTQCGQNGNERARDLFGKRDSKPRLLQKIDSAARAAARLALTALPKTKKDAIAVNAVNVNGPKFAELLERFMLSWGIELTVDSVAAKHISEDAAQAPYAADV